MRSASEIEMVPTVQINVDVALPAGRVVEASGGVAGPVDARVTALPIVIQPSPRVYRYGGGRQQHSKETEGER